jgi:hypothetical protein
MRVFDELAGDLVESLDVYGEFFVILIEQRVE